MDTPKIVISFKDIFRLKVWMNEANNNEIIGLGIVGLDEDKKKNKFLSVKQFHLCKHTGSSGRAAIDNDAAREIYKMYKPGEINLQWHTHPRMGTGPSGIDDKEMTETMKFLEPGQFRIMLIFNEVDSEAHCEMWYKTDVPLTEETAVIKKELKVIVNYNGRITKIGGMNFFTQWDGMEKEIKELKKEYANKVVKSTYNHAVGYNNKQLKIVDSSNYDVTSNSYLDEEEIDYLNGGIQRLLSLSPEVDDYVEWREDRDPLVEYLHFGKLFNFQTKKMEDYYVEKSKVRHTDYMNYLIVKQEQGVNREQSGN